MGPLEADEAAMGALSMPITLLNVGEYLSLEFAIDDLAPVLTFVRDSYPDFKAKSAGIATIIRFGGEKFTFQSEWDDPCLISSSTKGDALLRYVHDAVGGQRK